MKRLLLFFGMIACWLGSSAQTNIAPAATVTATTCNSAPCSAFNDLNFGTCGNQQVWISGSTGISIEWTWPSVQAFDEMVIHHGDIVRRFLSGFTMERWDGSAWVTIGTVSNLPLQCSSVVAIPKTFSSRFRISNFTVSGTQTNNPNFREIEIFQASTSPDDAGISSVDQSLTSSCPGTFPVFVNVENFGTNQINGVTIDWEVNGVLQTPVTYSTLLDTANGLNPSSALVNLGNITYAPATNYNVKAWTSMPNMGTDTVNDNDTASATLALSAPQGLGVQNVLATSADVVFGAVPGITYQAIVVPAGTPASAGTATPAQATSPINITGLTASTLYDVYLFADCGTSFSDTAGPEAFATPIQGPLGVNCITGLPGPVFTEDFESSTPALTGLGTGNGVWRLNSGGTTSGSTGPLGAHQGSQYIYYETSGSNPTSGAVVTGAIDLTTANDSAELSFWIHAFGATMGTLNVGVGTSATGPFTQVFTSTGAIQLAQGDPWQNVGVRLDSYVGQTIYLEFDYTSTTSFTGDMAIDLIEITTCVTCPNPSGLTNNSVTANSANMSWTGSASQFEVEYGTVGYVPGTGTSATATGNSYTITGLTPATAYDVYVRADCSAGSNGFSGWVGPVNIQTLCTVFTAPFLEDFDGTTWVASGNNAGNQIDGCWNSSPDVSQNNEPFKWIPRSTGPTSGNGPLQDVTGVNFMYVEASGSGSGDTAALETPAVDVSGLTTPALYFEQHRFSNGSNLADLEIYVSNDFGATWTQEYSVTGEVQTSTGDPYELVFVNLGTYTGDTIIVRFLQRGNGCCGDAAIDKVEIKEAPTCPWPTGQSFVGATDTNATITFNDPTGASWDVEWGPIGFAQGTGSVSSFANDTITFGPLSPNTCYDVYVRTNCSANSNGVSIWRGPIQFCTQCVAFTAPYTQNFDGTTAPELDNCWNPLAFNPSATNFELQTDAFRNFSPPNSMEVHNASATSGWVGIASPRFSDLDTNKRIEFQVYDEDGQFGGSDLIIGVMSDLSDETTFEAVDTIFEGDMPNDVWDFVVVDLTGHTVNNGGHVVFRHGMNTSFDNIHVDDFDYKEIPACQAPLSNTLGITGITNVGATALWGSGSQGVKTYIAWGTPGFVPQVAAQLGIDSVAGTVDQYGITGLTAQTNYEFYIQDSCATAGLSPWIGPFAFTTACNIFTAPFAENFDGTSWVASGNNNNNVLDPCWSSTPDVTASSVFKWIPRSTGPTSGNGPTSDKTGVNFLYCEASGASSADSAVLNLPYIDASSLVVPAIYFSQHRFSNNFNLADMRVEVTNDFGSTWTQVYSVTGDIQTASGDPFTDEIIPLGNFVGDTIGVRFIQMSNGCCGDAAIDDVRIAEAPSCPDVISLTTSNLTDVAATLNWTGNPNTVSYEVWYGPQGFYQGTLTAGGTRQFVTPNVLGVSGLTPNTCYEFLVRGICQPGDTGNWVGPVIFCTPCAAFPAPYAEDFDNVSTPLAGDFGNCWNGFPDNTASFSFRSNTGTTGSFGTGPNGDATSGNGVYLYTEASSGTTGNIAELYSPLINLAGQTNPEFKFAYHMFGSNIDSLTVDINPGTGWQRLMFIQGQQQTSNAAPWRDTAVSISAFTGQVQFRFNVTRGTGLSGDVSIDDVEIGDPILNDAEFNGILVTGGCGDSTTEVSAVFTNLGANTITSLPVSVNVTGTKTTTLNATYSGSLATDQSDTVLVGTINTYAGDSLFFAGTANLPGDQVALNDSASEGPVEFTPFAPIGFDTTACASDDSVYLRALGLSGVQYAWFGSNSPTDTIPLASGDTVAFPASSALSTYYLQYLTGVQGSLTTTFAGGNGQAGNTFDVLPTNAIALNGMDIHIGGTATEDVSVYYRLGTAVGNSGTGQISSWTLHESFTGVTGAGVGNPTNLQFTAPLNLPGGQVSAILVVLTSSTNIDYTNGATVGAVFASNNDLTVYEGFGIGWNAGDISGSFSPRNFNGTLYYGGGGCSELRTPINVNLGVDTTEANFTTTGNQPTFNFDATASVNADSYLWDFGDGNNGTGVTTSHTYATNGVYTVELTTLDTTGCASEDTATIELTVNVGLEENALGRSLNVFPNPANDVVNVSFETMNSGEVRLRLVDVQGREIMVVDEKVNGSTYQKAISVKALSSGMYILEVQNGDLKARRAISVK